MGFGMGMLSIGIYFYELFKFYDVENIICIGLVGVYIDKLNLYDVVIVKNCWLELSYVKIMGVFGRKKLLVIKKLNIKLKNIVKCLGILMIEGIIYLFDVFYCINGDEYKDIYEKYGVLCVEMESFVLFVNVLVIGKNVVCILIIFDLLVIYEVISVEEC